MRIVRRVLAGVGIVLLVFTGAFAWFLHAPTPTVPELSAAVRRDSIAVAGRMRSFLVFAPARRASSPPLLLVLHGSMGTGEQMRQATAYGFERLADREGFLVVYPQGYEGHWNDCRKDAPFTANQLGIDDVSFMRALVARFRSDHGIDSAQVFAVGLSNGGHMSYRLALEAPDLVRAVAAVGASVPVPESLDCTDGGGSTPVLILNGTADPINPYEGGRVTLFGFGDRGSVLSAYESAAYFARRNGITAMPVTEVVDPPGWGGATSAERTRWPSDGGADVVLYSILGGGHTFPQPDVRMRRILGRTHQALDGPAEIWRFLTMSKDRHGSD